MSDTTEIIHGPFKVSAYKLPKYDYQGDIPDRWIMNIYRASDGRSMRGGQKFLIRMPTEEELHGLVEEWLYEKAGAKAPEPVYCGTGCGAELVPEMNSDTDYQFDNALWINFDGGYGMFIDPFDEAPPKVVICHECAHSLCDAVPWMKELLNPHSSHSHKTAYAEANPDHGGWDYDYQAERAEEG
jgi:hypothetical protein